MKKSFTIPEWAKSLLGIGGILLFLVGLQIGLGVLCRTSLAFSYAPPHPLNFLLPFLAAVSMVGTGGALGWHSLASLQKKNSTQLSLPVAPLLIGLAGIVVIRGFTSQNSSFFLLVFLPLLCLGSAIPSLLALCWFRDKLADRLTWRRGALAFTSSGFLGLISLLAGVALWTFIRPSWLMHFYLFLDSPTPEVIVVLAGFLGLAVLIVELVKPLIALPFLSQLARRDIFLVGAVAGAGFVPFATVVYVGLNPEAWFLILILTILGGAVHLLSSGLVALAWYDLAEKPAGWPRWLAYYGLAVALQMVWNLGFLLLVVLNRFSFLQYSYLNNGDIYRLLWAGSWFILLVIGGITWWGGYLMSRPAAEANTAEPTLEATQDVDRSIAIWAAACLVAIVPVGIISLYLLQ